MLTLFHTHRAVAVKRNNEAVLEGTAEEGMCTLHFTNYSGASGELLLRISDGNPDFRLEGNGTIQIGNLPLGRSFFTVTPGGIRITAPIQWSNQQVSILFNIDAWPFSLHGTARFSEPLETGIFSQENIRFLISVKGSGKKENMRCRLSAWSNSVKGKVTLEENLEDLSGKNLSLCRRKLLHAWQKKIDHELNELEDRLSTVLLTADMLETTIPYDHPPGNGQFGHPANNTGKNIPENRSYLSGYQHPVSLRTGHGKTTAENHASLHLHGRDQIAARSYLSGRAGHPPAVQAIHLAVQKDRHTPMHKLPAGYLPRQSVQNGMPSLKSGYIKGHLHNGTPADHENSTSAINTYGQAYHHTQPDFHRLLQLKDLFRAVQKLIRTPQ